MCAFCLITLDTAAPGSLWMGVGSDRVEGSQGFYVHGTCIAERLHPEMMFVAASFEPGWADDPEFDHPPTALS